MKTSTNQTIRNAVVAETIVNGIRRALESVHGVKSVDGVSERALLRYAKNSGMLLDDETALCVSIYGSF